MFVQLLLVLSIVMLGSPNQINILDMLTFKITDFENENYQRFEDEFYSYYNTSDVKEIRKMHARRLLSFMNKSVDPCEDFYEFSCGNFAQYVDGTDLDGDSSFGNAFNIRALQNILDKGVEDEDAAAICDFYDSCILYGVAPQTVSQTINYGLLKKIQENYNWLEALVFLSGGRMNVLFRVNDNDEVYFNVGGNQSEFDSHSEFMEYATKVVVEEFGLSESSWLMEGIGDVYEFERNLKEVVYSLDPRTSETYDKEYLKEIFPNVNFRKNTHYEFAKWKDLTDFMQNTDRETILRYYFWEFCKRTSETVAQWNELTSSEQQFTCASIAVELMPDQAGYLFTKKFLNPEAVEDLSEMTENIREQLRMMFQQNSWFDRATRNEAVAKLDNIEIVYGLPEFVMNGSLRKQKKEYFYHSLYTQIFLGIVDKNIMINVQRNDEARDVNRWKMRNTLEVNAGYSPAGIIFIYMGMLVPPIYHVHLPHFFKYGNLGVTIAHELMHGFDNNGIKFNSEFKESDLFTPRLKAKFIRSAECIYTLYNKKYNADGLLTISENIPDIVGLEMGFKAYRKWADTVENVDEVELDGYEDLGLTKDQLFFFSQSVYFCSLDPNSQEPNDPHAPPKIRMNAAVDNSKDFAKAFNCPVKSEGNFQDKCHYLS